MSISVSNLTKIYGNQKALDNISFEAHKGEIVGFLGPNGAGKSTTMKITTGYLPPSEGTVKVCGLDVEQQPIKVKSKIGYLPENNPLYLDMYVREYLSFVGKVHGMPSDKLKNKVDEMIQLCGLTREQNKKIEALSKGYRQRVGLAQALIHDPEVLVLDEPTTGLDPNQIVEIRELIRNSSRDKTVIFSSHIMQEVQALCNRVVVIDQGKIVADDQIKELTSIKVEVVTILLEFADVIDTTGIENIKEVISIEMLEGTKYRVKATTEVDIRPVLVSHASEHGYVLLGIQQQEVTMENVFQELTKPKT